MPSVWEWEGGAVGRGHNDAVYPALTLWHSKLVPECHRTPPFSLPDRLYTNHLPLGPASPFGPGGP